MIKKILAMMAALSLSATVVMANETKDISAEYEYFENTALQK